MIEEFIENTFVRLIVTIAELCGFVLLVTSGWRWMKDKNWDARRYFLHVLGFVIPVLVSGAVAYLLNFLIVCYTPVGDSLGCSDLRSLSTILDGIPSLSVLFLLPVVLSLILMRHSARRNLRYISYVLNRRNSQRFSLFSPNILGVRRYLLGLLAYIIVFASSLVVLAIIYPVFRQPDAVTGAICAGPLFGTLFLLTVSFSMTLIHF